MVQEPDQWKSHLDDAQYIINNTHHTSIKSTPSKIMFGFDQKRHANINLSEYLNTLTVIDQNIETEREANRNIASEAISKLNSYNKRYYDKHHKKPSKYKPGEYVLIYATHNLRRTKAVSSRLITKDRT